MLNRNMRLNLSLKLEAAYCSETSVSDYKFGRYYKYELSLQNLRHSNVKTYSLFEKESACFILVPQNNFGPSQSTPSHLLILFYLECCYPLF
jgi:hypothetical protein